MNSRDQQRLEAGRRSASKLLTIGDALVEDLHGMSREQLFVEVQKLRQGIRRHRDSTLHDSPRQLLGYPVAHGAAPLARRAGQN